MFFRKKTVSQRIDKANDLFNALKPQEAYTSFEQLVKEHPENLDVLFHFAVAQNSTGRKEQAIETLKGVLLKMPNHEDALFILPCVIQDYAHEVWVSGDLHKAKKLWEEFITLPNGNISDLAYGHSYLASIENEIGNKNKAILYARQAIKVDPSNPSFQESLDELLINNNE